MDIYSYHEGEEIERGAVAPLELPYMGLERRTAMKREEMRGKINEELKHIPRSFKSSNQNMLREYYNGMRMTNLSLNPASPANDSLLKAMEALRKNHPDFLPIYDREFFR